MRRHRWLLVLGLALGASGCSGTQLMGVAKQSDGSVELRSYCTNEGLTRATIRTDAGGVVGTMDATTEGRQTVEFPAGVLDTLEPADVVTFDADYAGTGFFAEPLTIEFGDLEPGTVVISGLDPEVVTPAEFEDRKVSCGFDASRLGWLVALFVGAFVAMIVVVAVALLLIRYLLTRGRGRVSQF